MEKQENNLFSQKVIKILQSGMITQTFGISAILFGMCVLLSIVSPFFFTSRNFLNILLQTSINTIVAVGETFVILTAGIDLGVGSVVALSGVFLGGAMKASWPILFALMIGIAVGSLTGFFNGVVIAKGRVPPFVATLGMMSMARGLALIYTKGQSIYVFPQSFLKFFGTGYLWIIPMPGVIAITVVVISYYILSQTRFGRYIYAIGSNIEAAKLSGINVNKILISVYTYAGITYALGGAVLTGRLNSAQPIGGVGYELDAIAAVVIGGTSLSGGRGTVWGTVFGALFMGVLRNGLNLLNVSSYVQQFFIGLIIIIAVLIDQSRKKIT